MTLGYVVGSPGSEDVAWVRRYGGPVSHSILDASFKTFRVSGIEGFIGFRLHHGCAVAMGDPICHPEYREDLARAFAAYCAEYSWPVIFAVASDAMRPFIEQSGGALVQVAELLIADPQQDPLNGPRGSHLRTCNRHSAREGVTVREYDGNGAPDPALEERVMRAMETWRSQRQGLQLHIGSHLVFRTKKGCRWFLAEQADRIVGVLTLLEINDELHTSLIDLVFSTPDAPLHTNELLIVTAFQRLKEGDSRRCWLGVAPGETAGELKGFGPMSTRLARFFYTLAIRLVPQKGKGAFWKKFGIVQKDPLYMMFLTPRVGLREFRALLSTFNLSL